MFAFEHPPGEGDGARADVETVDAIAELEKGDEVASCTASHQEHVIPGLQKPAIEDALPAHQAREDRGLTAKEFVPGVGDRLPQIVKTERSRGEIHRGAAGEVERLAGAPEQRIQRRAPAAHHAPDDTARAPFYQRSGMRRSLRS